jgi:hypothetical protein
MPQVSEIYDFLVVPFLANEPLSAGGTGYILRPA